MSSRAAKVSMGGYNADPEGLSASPIQNGHEAATRPSAAPQHILEEDTIAMFYENIGPVEHALLFSAGDASQKKHNYSRTNAIFNGTQHPTEAVSPNSRNTVSGNRVSTDSTISTNRSSFADNVSTRSSRTSFSSDGMNGSTPSIEMRQVPENPKSDSSTRRVCESVKRTYMCPNCNMGTGHILRTYRGTRNEQVLLKNRWDTTEPFDRHIMEDHVDAFKRMNSSEYVCCYCPCASVGSKDPECGGRFETAGDLVNHLRDRHSSGPRRLGTYPHNCAPISNGSYPQALRDRLDDI